MIGTKKRTRQQAPLLPEQLTWIRGKLSQWTTLTPLDLARLSSAEQRDLLQLVKDASAGSGNGADCFNPDLLGRSRAKLERLTEKAADRPGAFKKGRESAALRAQLDEIAAEALKPAPRPRFEEAGSVTLPAQWVTDFMARDVLWVSHVGLLVTLLAWFENAQVPPRVSGAAFERDPDGALVLLVDSIAIGFGAVTGGDGLPCWKREFDHLVLNKFFEVEKNGRHWRVKLGSRSLNARKRRSR